MASNKNIPQKGQGANEPDKRQSVQSDAADVDWMIMSDISTRIGGSPAIKPSANQSPAKSPSQISINQDVTDDLEDLEFLRSIGFDDAIESPSSLRREANISGNNEVNNIDWLIVTDLNVRKENAESKAQFNPSYQDIGQSQTTLQTQTDNITDSLDEDLGLDLDGFDFLENSDFPDLDSLSLGTSASISTDDLQNEIDNTEGKIRGLAELLDDNDDSSFDLVANEQNDDWDSISGIFENDFDQLSSEPNLGAADESPEIPSQVSEVFGASEDASGNIDLGSNLFSEDNASGDLLVGDLDLSDQIQDDLIVEDLESRNGSQDLQLSDLLSGQDQDLSFDEFEVVSLEAKSSNKLGDDFGTLQSLGFDEFGTSSPEAEVDNKLDDNFGAAPSLESFAPSVAEDEFWSNTASNFEAEAALDDSVANTFTNDWGVIAENAIDDAVWDTTPSIANDLVSSTSIDNAFGITDDWEIQPKIGKSEAEDNIDFELPNLNSFEVFDVSWDTTPSIATDRGSSTSIDNAFGTSNAWESLPTIDQPELEEHEEHIDLNLPLIDSLAPSEVEEYVDFELANVDFSLESIESEFESKYGLQLEPVFEQSFDQIDNELEAEIEYNENWGVKLDDANEISTENIGYETSLYSSREDDISITDSGEEADWSKDLETEIEVSSEEADWSASLEAEISNGNDVNWDAALVESEDYLTSTEESSEIFNDNLLGLVNSTAEQSISEDFNFAENLEVNDWAIADHANNLDESYSESESVNLGIPEILGDFSDISENVDIPEQFTDQKQFADFNEFIDPSLNDIEARLEDGGFDFSGTSILASSEWENLSEPIAASITESNASYADSFAVEQFTDSSLINNFASTDSVASDSDLAAYYVNYADGFAADSGLTDNYADSFSNDIAPTVKANLGRSNSEPSITEANALSSQDDNNLGSMLDEDFDLAAFDEDSLLDISNPDFNFSNTPTTLTPVRSTPDAFLDDTITSGYTHQQSSINSIDSFADNLVSQADPFEEALVNDLLNENYEEVNFEEEALARDLLINSLVSDSDGFVPAKESPTMPTPMPTPNSNIAASTKFDLGADRDFLDDFDFDLESIDPLDDDGFNDAFASAQISTGLTPPAPSIAPIPASLPPLTKQEPTSPSINLPPPLPFLPPLPPKRNPTQGSTTPPVPAYPAVNTGGRPLPQNRMGIRSEEDDFDRFHDQPDKHRNRNKPIGSIDEGWSDLLDADTVLSGGRSSSEPSYTDMSSNHHSAGKSSGRDSQGGEREAHNSSSSNSGRKETGLPDCSDFGLEVYADNTDWSGLLDSGDLSDSITTISPQSTQSPSQIRTKQARMSAPPDQIDFNRFTEDNYDAYSGYEQTAPPSAKTFSKQKLTIPSVSLESLWQNYLKIPAIGLGVIGGAFLLYTFLNRPIFDLGLRWGLFKDASGRDFTNADFRGVNLDKVDFSKATLTGAKMQDASLVGASFQGANLDGVNFAKANLNRARLIQASVIWAEFGSAQMNLVDLAGSDLTRSNFVGAKMEGANLKDSKIGAQGTEKATKFSPTTLLAWQIVNEPREGRNLAGQNLSGLNLSFTSLKRANLTNVKLNFTDMTNTDLSGANLSGGEINGANWSGAKLNGININGVRFDKTKLPKTDEKTICPNSKKGPCKF
ncbi:MAG: pentapeptide repeat-containing protein [Pseudanabaena sp.]